MAIFDPKLSDEMSDCVTLDMAHEELAVCLRFWRTVAGCIRLVLFCFALIRFASFEQR